MHEKTAKLLNINGVRKFHLKLINFTQLNKFLKLKEKV